MLVEAGLEFYVEVNNMGYPAASGFALILVLFILLVIIGTAYVCC